MEFAAQYGYRQLRRLAIAAIGGTVLLIGLALLILPGPAFLVIPLGLAILATEFVWAKRVLRRAKRQVVATRNRFRKGKWGDRKQPPEMKTTSYRCPRPISQREPVDGP